MMNNYNSLSYRKGSVLNSQETEVVANAPNTSGKRRTWWIMSLILFFLLFVGTANAQTTIISPTGAGAFEGADFTADGWTALNNATTNVWVNNTGATAGFTGSKCAYITNNPTGTPPTHTYNNAPTSSTVSCLYRDVTVPAGQSTILLSFKWICNGESGWDRLQVWAVPTTFTPPNGTSGITSTGSAPTGRVALGNGTGGYVGSSSWATANITVPAAYAGTTFRLVFQWRSDTGGGSNPPIAIDDVSLVSSCTGAVATAATSITNTSANANWNTFSGATSYDLQYRTVGSGSWSTLTSLTGTTTSLTGLSVNTAYEYQVRANGSTCSSWSSSITFTTLCNATTIPYSEDFETAVVPALPACVTSSHPLTRSTTATGAGPRSGTKYQNIRWTPTVTKYLYSAPLALTASTSYDMGGWYMTDGISGWTTIKLYANTSASVTGATLLTTVSGATNTTYSKLSGTYIPSSTGTYYFIIEVVHNGTPNDMSIDDLFAILTPTCFEPTGLTVSNLTPTTADISWTAPATGTTPVQYQYAVTTSATPPASGTVSTSTSVTGVTITPNTNYYLHVRSECVLGTDYSAWVTSAPFKFISGDVCAYAIDLSTLTSPTSNTTVGAANNFTPSCSTSNAPDIYYKINVPAGYTLNIGQSTNGYDSIHSTFYGSCASQTAIQCMDDPDTPADGTTSQVSWTNSTGSAQDVYWVQDGYTTNSGTFTLQWALTPPPIVLTSFAPTAVCSADLATSVITLTGSNFTGATDVKLNGVSHTFTVVNDTTITVNLTATSTAGTFVVYNAVTSGTNSTSLIINTNPTVDPINGGGVTELCAPNTLALTDNTAAGVWSSSNSAIATVDSAGLVTGVAEGTVVISYTVTDNGCSTSATYSINVKNPVNITTQPAPQIILTGANASFSVAATGTGITYQWQENTGSGFANITDGGVYSGATTNSLTITGATAGMNGYEYQCVVTGTSPCAPSTSNSALLTVSNTGISSHPSNVNLCDSGTATFSVTGTGDINSYQWYEDNGFGPVAISNGGDYSGATSATLTVSNVTTAKNGFTYYVDVIGPAITVSSTTATLNVATGVSFSANPANQTVCYTGGSATFNATAAGTFTGYQWQYSTDNSGWNNVVNGTPAGATYSGATTAALTVTTTASTPASGTYYYRALAIAQAPCADVPSTSAQLLINNPAITSQPVATTVVAGNTTSFTAASNATGTVTYQWQYATTATGTYANVANGTPANVTYSGENTTTLSVTPAASAAASTANYYRLVVTADGCSVASNGAQLTIANYCQPATTSGGTSDSVTNVVITNVTQSTNVTQASSAAAPWYTLYNNTPLNVTQGENMSVAITFGTDGTQYSAVWVDYNRDGTFSASENVALATTAAAGSSTVTYNFVVPMTATPGVTRIRVRGASDSAYTAAGACTSTSWGETEDYFLNIVAAPACSGTPVAGTATSNIANVCFSGSANLSATGYSTGVTGISLQWYNSAGAISGANAATYTTPVLSAPETYFLRVTCDNSGLSADTNSVTIGVNAPSVDSTTPGERCGTGTVNLGATASSGATLNWYSSATGGTPLGSGTSFTTPSISTTTNYYVEATIGGTPSTIGKASTTGADGSYIGTATGIVFNAASQLNLNSAVIYPTGTGTVTVALYNSSGTELASTAAISVTGSGLSTPVTLPLGFSVPVGTGYRLLVKAYTGITGLLRDFSGVTYPYTSTNASITGGWISGSSTTYYFFYNVNISTGCSSARTAVQATVNTPPALTISSATSTICEGSSTTTPVTITSNVADYDTYTWSPSAGVSGNSTSGYTFNPTATTTFTLTASNTTTGCANTATHTVTVNARPGAFSVSPATSNVCSIDAATLLSIPPVNSTPAGSCLEEGNGLYPSGTYTPTTCNGTTANVVTSLGYAGEYSNIAVSANTLYTFASSGTGDYVTISDSTGTTVLAYGLSPVTYFNATAGTLRFYSQSSSCTAGTTSRTRSVICKPVDAAVFSPTAGLYTDAAATVAYTGGAVFSVYAKPSTTTTYTATATNASGCVRTATATVNVTTATTWYLDADADGYGTDATTMLSCTQPTGYVAVGGDCDDATATTHPGAVDVCYDGIDNDCNGIIDNVGLPGGCVMPEVVSSQCGATISNMFVTIQTTWISGAQEYRFKVTNMTTNAIQYVDRPVNNLSLSNVPGTTLGTQYKIEVTVKMNGNWLPNYGNACYVTTPSNTTTVGSQCNTTLTSMSQWVYANTAANASGYRFRVTNTVNNSVQVTDQPYNRFNFNQLASRSFATLYTVEVAVKDLNGNYLPYGSACNVTTPAFPTTQVRSSQCNYTATSNTEMIAADVVTGATKYRFRIFSTSPAYDQYIDRNSINTFNLSMFSGLLPSTTYSVQVAVYIGTEWGPYDKTCSITTPGVAKAAANEIVQAKQAELFKVVAYPNPYTNEFQLNVTTSSDSVIEVKVYDMIGKLIEQTQVEPKDIETLQIGNKYPSGVYNVIISQGDENKTLRVIKR